MARLLGPEGYGIVSVALSVAATTAMMSTLGFGPLAVREVARVLVRGNRPELRGFLRFAGGTVLAASIIAGGAVAAFALSAGIVGPAYREAIALSAAMIPLLAWLLYFRGVCQGFGQVVAAQIPGDLLRPLLLVVCLSVLFLSGARVTSTGFLLIALSIVAFAASVAAWIVHRLAVARTGPVTPEVRARKWSRAAAPFLAVSILGPLGIEINTLLLGWLATPTDAGLFQPVARLTPIMLIGMEAIAIPYAPRVAELWERGETHRLQDVTAKTTAAATALALASCAAILTLAPWILGIFGNEFPSVAPALWWIAAAQIFNAACGPVGMLLMMTGHDWAAARAMAAGVAAAAITGVITIPGHGPHGAAMGLAAGIVVWNCLMVIDVRRRLRLRPTLLSALRLLARRTPAGTSDPAPSRMPSDFGEEA